MEQNGSRNCDGTSFSERPRWFALIEALPEATRQTVGNLCASTIQNLAVLALISGDLFDAVIDQVK